MYAPAETPELDLVGLWYHYSTTRRTLMARRSKRKGRGSSFFTMRRLINSTKLERQVSEPDSDDEVCVMDFEHKTGGVPIKIHKNVLKRTRRKNYGTNLSTISPTRH